jgi:small subunit ribosomal protein S13
MHRIVGLNLPEDKRIDYALTLIYGIGWTLSKKVLTDANVPAETRVKDITEDQLKKLVAIIDKNYRVEGELREDINDNMKRLREIGSTEECVIEWDYLLEDNAQSLMLVPNEERRRTVEHYQKKHGQSLKVERPEPKHHQQLNKLNIYERSTTKTTTNKIKNKENG